MASRSKGHGQPKELVITFAPGLKEKMAASVGRLPPEHYAILVGRLDDPFRVVDLRPMPPMIDSGGRWRTDGASVTLNAPFIEYYLNTEVLPAGMYFLGAIHSHPGSMSCLSGTAAGRQGDIPSMRRHLANAQGQGFCWTDYLAPIVTSPGADPQVTGWVVRLDHDEPMPSRVVWEEATAGHGASSEEVITPAEVQTWWAGWQAAIAEAENDGGLNEEDRSCYAATLRRFRAHAFEERLRLLPAQLGPAVG